jgi:PAS domain S-box-containing protein
MANKLKILILEDSRDDVELIERELSKGGLDFVSLVVDKKNEFENALTEFKPEVIICDHSLPQFNSTQALQVYKSHASQFGSSIPFILVTGSVSDELAAEVLKSGADDYILKDRLKRLPSSIQNALRKCQAENEKHKVDIENSKFLHILQQSLNEIYIFNAGTLSLQYVNDGALKNLGYSAAEITSLRLPDIQPQFTVESFKEVIGPIELTNTQKRVYETMHRRKDGTLYHGEVHLQLIVEEQQIFFLAIVIDITERKKHLSKILQQNEKLREIAWMQSHEIRAPLARIMGLINLLSRYNHGGQNLDELLGYIMSSANEMDDIIKKIVRETEKESFDV